MTNTIKEFFSSLVPQLDLSGSIAIVGGTPWQRRSAAKRLLKRLSLAHTLVDDLDTARDLAAVRLPFVWVGDELPVQRSMAEFAFSEVLIMRTTSKAAAALLPSTYEGLAPVMTRAPLLGWREAIAVRHYGEAEVVRL
jgi:hypothetical protein